MEARLKAYTTSSVLLEVVVVVVVKVVSINAIEVSTEDCLIIINIHESYRLTFFFTFLVSYFMLLAILSISKVYKCWWWINVYEYGTLVEWQMIRGKTEVLGENVSRWYVISLRFCSEKLVISHLNYGTGSFLPPDQNALYMSNRM